ncbi:DUF4331 family protein [Sphingomonas sp. YR710]|uniref:DUF4331 family protein n=1 Tax=Sphingomonas sp. YR710 TaxID=1882773 RepID=UPI0015A25F25|nr:DUF4331 family protein [Sphingomonas sp. YR710]
MRAADHLDPPARTDPAVDLTPDKAADITDVYAWHTDTSLIIALNFAGPQATNLPGAYDRDVLYTINISNDANPTTSEFPIEIRFGQDGTSTGVQIKGAPGTTGPIVGPVETDLQKDGVLAHAGLLDDPFFFDLQGFRATKSTGKLSFDNTRNFFAGQNLTSVVLQIPRAAVENGTNPIRIWATSARFGGQL